MQQKQWTRLDAAPLSPVAVPVDRTPRALLLLASVLLVFMACSRKAEPQRDAVASASAASSKRQDPAPSEWVSVLDPKKLGAAKFDDPGAVVQALAQRRASSEPLLEMRKDVSKKRLEQANRRVATLMKEGYHLRKNPPVMLKPPIDWGSNPRNDSNWHYLVNSLRPVGTLLSAYRTTHDQHQLALATGVALDWIDYNLVRNKRNEKKWHDMGSALRAQRMSEILDAELRLPKPDTKAVGLLIWALDQHAKFLNNPKKFSKGNHGVFMMLGLAQIVQALPELKGAGRYSRYAQKQMKALVASQFGPEGFHLEHSPGYHLFVMKTFARVVHDGLFKGVPELAAAVKLARKRAPELYHPNGDLVMLGDSERDSGDAGHTLATTKSDPEFWDSLRVYPKVGYAIFRTHFGPKQSPSDDFLFVGAGHHSTFHKHADHLSFEWSFQGTPILIDSGKYSYTVDDWRRFFMSTRAGNAVEVDEKDYSRRPDKVPPKLSSWGKSKGLYYVVAQRRDTRMGVSQTRLFVLNPAHYLVVLDRMQSDEPHDYRQWFHFHEALDVKRDGQMLGVLDEKKRRLLVVRELSQDKATEVELVKGQTKPRIQGFISPDYKKKEPRYSLAFVKHGKSADWVTLFSGEPPRAAKLVDKQGSLSATWKDSRGVPQGFRFTPDAKQPFQAL